MRKYISNKILKTFRNIFFLFIFTLFTACNGGVGLADILTNGLTANGNGVDSTTDGVYEITEESDDSESSLAEDSADGVDAISDDSGFDDLSEIASYEVELDGSSNDSDTASSDYAASDGSGEVASYEAESASSSSGSSDIPSSEYTASSETESYDSSSTDYGTSTSSSSATTGSSATDEYDDVGGTELDDITLQNLPVTMGKNDSGSDSDGSGDDSDSDGDASSSCEAAQEGTYMAVIYSGESQEMDIPEDEETRYYRMAKTGGEPLGYLNEATFTRAGTGILSQSFVKSSLAVNKAMVFLFDPTEFGLTEDDDIDVETSQCQAQFDEDGNITYQWEKIPQKEMAAYSFEMGGVQADLQLKTLKLSKEILFGQVERNFLNNTKISFPAKWSKAQFGDIDSLRKRRAVQVKELSYFIFAK